MKTEMFYSSILLTKIALVPVLAAILLLVLFLAVKAIARLLAPRRSERHSHYDPGDTYYKQNEQPRSYSHSNLSSRKPQKESTDLVVNVATNMAIYSAIEAADNSNSYSSDSNSYSSSSDSSSSYSSSDSSSSYSYD
jgi:hypothetical protein